MAFSRAIIEYLEAGLRSAMSEYAPADAIIPLNAERYLAMSALQKAIRRNRPDVALRATRTLLNGSVSGFWRRLGIIAFEDIGVANLDLVGQVALAVREPRLRAALGGDGAVASVLVSALCCSAKDRAVDDLLVQLIEDRALESWRNQLVDAQFPDHFTHAINCTYPIERRALAAWFAVGCRYLKDIGKHTLKGCPESFFDGLRDAGISGLAVEVARLGWRRADELMPSLLPLVASKFAAQVPQYEDDELLPETELHGLTTPAIDKHSRLGLLAFGDFLAACPEMDALLRAHPRPGLSRTKQFGLLVFRIEGTQELRRLKWPLGTELRATADRLTIGLPPAVASEATALLREQFALLNQCRANRFQTCLR